MKWLASIASVSLLALILPLPCSAIPAEGEPPTDPHLNDPKPTRILVRVVAHGAMVLGREGRRRPRHDHGPRDQTRCLATGIQQGEAGDQNQIMRTPHLMEEPVYSARAAAAFTTTLELRKPTLVEITGGRAARASGLHATGLSDCAAHSRT
jgi:hypothetical protein